MSEEKGEKLVISTHSKVNELADELLNFLKYRVSQLDYDSNGKWFIHYRVINTLFLNTCSTSYREAEHVNKRTIQEFERLMKATTNEQ